ncbi:MAG: folate-binding protein [Rhodospirillales bacterium]
MSAAFVIAEDRGVLAVSGEDRVAFLQGLVSNDVAKVDAGHAIYAALLTAQGRYLHDFFIAAHVDPKTGESLLIDVERARLPDLQKKLSLYKLRSKVALRDVSDELVVGLAFGDDVASKLGLKPEPGAAVAVQSGLAFVDPRLAALGARAIQPKDTAEMTLSAAGLGIGQRADYEMLRLKLGIPDGARDLPIEKAMLMESGFDELNGIDWKKGCYMGQELTARTKYRGLVRKRLLPVAIEGAVPPPGTPITYAGKDAGKMRSGHDGRAIALLRLEVVQAAQQANAALDAGGVALRPEIPSWVKLPEPEAEAK